MNDIEIIGGKTRQREYASSMVNYCIKKLMPRMASLRIEVKLTKLKGDANGYCLRETDRDFFIEVDHTVGLRTMLETVAHEMVHVKQYARREMTDYVHSNTQASKAKYWKWKDQMISDATDYWDLPWEIEANGRECGLFIRWAQKEGCSEKKWANIK
jgi:hypothetical protein